MGRQLEKYEIRIYDKSSNQKSYVSSTALQPPVTYAKFVLARIGGCTTAEIHAPKPGLPGTVQCGYLLEFHAKPEGGSLDQYWYGEIIECPNAGTTAETYVYRARGLMAQLSDKLILQYYTNDDTDNIVTSLIGAEFTDDTDIDSGTGQVSIGTPYALGDAEFEFTTGAQALKMLAEAQKSVDYGVDQDGLVYFKDRDTTTVRERYWVGKHLDSYETSDNSENLMNSVLMQSKKIVSGGMLTFATTDSTSITSYGERMRLEQAPDLSDPDDVYRLAEGLVADEKDPQTVVEADPQLYFTAFQFPSGAVVVTDKDGNTETLPIQKTIYELDNSGFRGRFELGDEPVKSVDEEMRAIFREVAVSKQANISLVKIDHTRGEEWRQSALSDAREQGNYNSWFGTFDDTKGIDPDYSYQHHSDKDRGYAGCWVDSDGARIQTHSIPIGPNPTTHSGTQIDTVRLHIDQDWRGRVDFTHDDDLTKYFIGSANVWKMRTGYSHAEPVAATFMNYIDTGVKWVLPAQYNIKWGTKGMAAAGSTFYMYVGYKDANNLLWVEHANGAANFTAKLYEKVGGGASTQIGSTLTLTKDTNYQLEATIRTTATNCKLEVFDYSDVSQGSTSATRSVMTGMTQVGPYLWLTATAQAYLDYFEIWNEATVLVIELSRDGGTTWTDASVAEGTTNLNVDISGQPNGDGTLLMRASMVHPARLYGWGVSWT
jgi:hypothetical protein